MRLSGRAVNKVPDLSSGTTYVNDAVPRHSTLALGRTRPDAWRNPIPDGNRG